MTERVYFLNMFPDYEPPEELYELLFQAAVVAADIDPGKGRVEIALDCPRYIPKRLIDTVVTDIRNLYGLRDLSINLTHSADQLSLLEPEELLGMFVEQNSMHRAALAGANWNWEGERLNVKLLGNGVKELEESAQAVCRKLRERFAVAVNIHFEAGQALEGQALFDAMDKLRHTMLEPRTAAATTEKKAAPAAESVAFYGKPIKGPVTAMSEVTLDMGTVTIEGRVFAVEHKELKKRNAWVINFDMTDNNGSVRINRFMEANEAKPILENVKIGAVLKVQGKPELNRYDNEMVLKPFAMQRYPV